MGYFLSSLCVLQVLPYLYVPISDWGPITNDKDILDELQEHVESIDFANDLHSIGGLAPLLDYFRNSHPNIRAKAADVVSTIVQNNPRSQLLVMDANGLEPLSNFSSDLDVGVCSQALGAISSLIRHDKSGITFLKKAFFIQRWGFVKSDHQL